MNWVSDYYEGYCLWLVQQPFNERTKRIYAARINAFLEYLGHTSEVDCISQNNLDSAIAAFGQHLIDSNGARPTTVNSYLTVIANFCRFLRRDCSKLKESRIKYSGVIKKVLSEQERQLYGVAIDTCPVVRDRAMARLIHFFGLRIGECVALNIEDLELSFPAKLNLPQRRQDSKLTLDEKTSREIVDWLNQRPARILSNAGTALFVTKNGTRISTKGVDFALRRIGISCGLVVSARMLRNTCLRAMENSLQRPSQSIGPKNTCEKPVTTIQTPFANVVYVSKHPFSAVQT